SDAVKLWDARTGQELLVLRGSTGAVTGLCFSPDGQRLAAGSRDGTTRLWDARTGQTLLTFVGRAGMQRQRYSGSVGMPSGQFGAGWQAGGRRRELGALGGTTEFGPLGALGGLGALGDRGGLGPLGGALGGTTELGPLGALGALGA